MNNESLKLIKIKSKPRDYLCDTYISEPKLYMHHDGCKISEEIFVTVDEYIQYDINYLLITLHKNGKKIIVGRYLKEGRNILVSYKNGNIMLYYADYNYNTYSLSKIIKVINLYDIVNDMSYAVTEKEALELFDSNLSTDNLAYPNASLVEYNEVNNQKKIKKGINRFTYYGD